MPLRWHGPLHHRFIICLGGARGHGALLALVCRNWNAVIRSLWCSVSHERLILSPHRAQGKMRITSLQHLERICCLRICAPLSTWHSIAAASLDPPISCTGIECINFDTGNRTTGLVLPSTFLAGNSPRLRESPESSLRPPDVLLGTSAKCPNYKPQHWFLSSYGRGRKGKRKAAIVQFNHVVLSNLRLAMSAHTGFVTDRSHEIDFILSTSSHTPSRIHISDTNDSIDGIRSTSPVARSLPASPFHPPQERSWSSASLPQFDYQVASVAQICSALRPNFANMEGLFIKYHENQLPVEWHGQVDYELWREMITHFHVHSFQK
ncbi:hypothetical protein BGW80DRAFT_1251444 [Lactifluus volemus]|nr:hypothetical protein BGW80DRAFT_1251444 [Lactifluus volemus]